MKIFLATESKIKKNAVIEAFGSNDIIIKTKSVESGVPEQPYGLKNIIKGAENRIKCIRKKPDENGYEDYDIFMAIENGIGTFTIDDDMFCVDSGFVLIYSYDSNSKSYKRTFSFSPCVPIPMTVLRKSSESNFEKTRLIQKLFREYYHKNVLDKK